MLNSKIFSGEIPQTPLPRGSVIPSRALPLLEPSALAERLWRSMAVPLFKSRRRPCLDPLTPYLNNDAKRRVYGKNLAKKQKCSVPCSVLFSSRYIDEKKNLSSKICFRFRLIYISKFIGPYIYRNQSSLSYKKYSKNNLRDNACGLAT